MSKVLEPGPVQDVVAKGATVGGSGTAIFFGMSANELAALGGLVVAILGFLYNVWVQERRLRHEAQLRLAQATEAAEAAAELAERAVGGGG